MDHEDVGHEVAIAKPFANTRRARDNLDLEQPVFGAGSERFKELLSLL
jgi:hypothetical protein